MSPFSEVRTVFGDMQANAHLAQGWEVIGAELVQRITKMNTAGQPTEQHVQTAYIMGLPVPEPAHAAEPRKVAAVAAK